MGDPVAFSLEWVNLRVHLSDFEHGVDFMVHFGTHDGTRMKDEPG